MQWKEELRNNKIIINQSKFYYHEWTIVCQNKNTENLIWNSLDNITPPTSPISVSNNDLKISWVLAIVVLDSLIRCFSSLDMGFTARVGLYCKASKITLSAIIPIDNSFNDELIFIAFRIVVTPLTPNLLAPISNELKDVFFIHASAMTSTTFSFNSLAQSSSDVKDLLFCNIPLRFELLLNFQYYCN